MKKLFVVLALLPTLALAQNMNAAVVTDPGFVVNGRQAGVSKVQNIGTNGTARSAALRCATDVTDVPTYVVAFNVAATAATDILVFNGSANKVLRLRRIVLVNPGSATTAIVVDLQLGRATTFGSGGAVASFYSLDKSTRSAGQTGGGGTTDPDTTGAVVRTGDTVQAAGFQTGMYDPLVSVSVPTTAGAFTPQVIYDASDARFKPLTNANGVNVLVLRVAAIGAGATGFRGYAEFSVDDA